MLFHSGIGFDFEEEAICPGVGVVKLTKRKHGDVGANKSWLANRIGWRGERTAHEVSGPDGSALTLVAIVSEAAEAE